MERKVPASFKRKVTNGNWMLVRAKGKCHRDDTSQQWWKVKRGGACKCYSNSGILMKYRVVNPFRCKLTLLSRGSARCHIFVVETNAMNTEPGLLISPFFYSAYMITKVLFVKLKKKKRTQKLPGVLTVCMLWIRRYIECLKRVFNCRIYVVKRVYEDKK